MAAQYALLWRPTFATKADIEEAYSRYLVSEVLPPWTRAFCRRVLELYDANELDPRKFGVHRRATRTTTFERRVAWLALIGAATALVLSFLADS